METVDEIYGAPEADLLPAESAAEAPLAGRGARLGAAILDGILMSVMVVPVLFFFGVYDAAFNGQAPSWTLNLIGLPVGFIAWMLVNGYFLHQSGQTLGKKALGIRMVDLAGEKPGLARLAGLRFLLMQVFYSVPVAGGLVALLDCLMIFGKEKRCLHDRIAGTRVVKG